MNLGLSKGPPPPQTSQGGQKANEGKKRSRWTDNDLKDALSALDSGYTIKDVCEAFRIPRSLLKDHYKGRVRGRKMDPKAILTIEEEENLVEYMMTMVRLAHPLSVQDLKLKVVEICQEKAIPFKDGIMGQSWLK